MAPEIDGESSRDRPAPCALDASSPIIIQSSRSDSSRSDDGMIVFREDGLAGGDDARRAAPDGESDVAVAVGLVVALVPPTPNRRNAAIVATAPRGGCC